MHEYNNQLSTVYTFWQKNICTLTETQYDLIAIQLYKNIIKKLPNSKKFYNRSLLKQGRIFFGMFAWLIKQLHKKESKPQKLFKKLRKLGKIHKKLGIKEEWYGILLSALDETLVEYFKNKYTTRVQWCLSNLYTLVADIMMENDFYNCEKNDIKNNNGMELEALLKDIDMCINNPVMCEYLIKYANTQFCAENVHFCRECLLYENDVSYIKAKYIYDVYIKPNSEREVNISYQCRQRIITKMEVAKSNIKMDETIYIQAYKEIKKLILVNLWNGFKREMSQLLSLTGKHTTEIHLQLSTSNQSSNTISNKEHENMLKQIELHNITDPYIENSLSQSVMMDWTVFGNVRETL